MQPMSVPVPAPVAPTTAVMPRAPIATLMSVRAGLPATLDFEGA